jgi:hypothetical protein
MCRHKENKADDSQEGKMQKSALTAQSRPMADEKAGTVTQPRHRAATERKAGP